MGERTWPTRSRGAAPSLLVAALAWSMATKGATAGWEMVVAVVLLSAALLSTGAVAGAVRRRPGPATTTFLALQAWLWWAGPLRAGLSVDSTRVAMVLLAVLLTVATVAALDGDDREMVLRGVVVLGTVHAVVALLQVLVDVGTEGPLPARAASFLGYANALGALLVATLAVTLRQRERRPTPLLGAAVALQALALLATGGRFAIVAGLCVLAWHGATRTRGAPLLPVTALAVLGVTVVGLRFASAPPTRFRLWSATLDRILDRPLAGHGPNTAILDHNPAAVDTTHAHNEVLQLALEYGLVGLALATAVLVLAVRAGIRSSRSRPGGATAWLQEPLLAAAALALLASGLVDFTLRITAVAVTAAVVTTTAVTRPDPDARVLSAAAAPRSGRGPVRAPRGPGR